MTAYKNRCTFLGTGSSAGVPVIGCTCGVCRSSNPKDKRLRASLLLETAGKVFLIDAGPDFRTQALQYHIDKLDGVLFTHAHFDHLGGADDLRAYYFLTGEPVPCLASRAMLKEFACRYPYLFEPANGSVSYKAQLAFQTLPEERGSVDFQGVPVQYVTYEQCGMKITGYRFGRFAYISDIHDYPETIFQDLQGVETLVVSALRFAPSIFHFSVDEAVEFAHRVGAKRTFLTHMAHEVEHDRCEAYLSDGVKLAYDGLVVAF